VNQQFLASTLVIALGWLARRRLVDERGAEALVRLVFNLTLPALVLHTFDGVTLDRSLALLPALAATYGLVMAGLGALVLFRRRPTRERGLLTMLLPGFNVGLFAYPLVEAALGGGALRYLAMFDVGVAFSTFGVSCAVASHYAREGARLDLSVAWRALSRSVPFITYLVALGLALAGWRLPRVVADAAGLLARANGPLALLVLGLYLHLERMPGQWAAVARVVGTRLVAGAAIGVPLWLLLPVDPTFRAVLLAGLLQPHQPLISVSYAVQFGYDARLVGLLLNVANVVSYLLLWAVFNLAR